MLERKRLVFLFNFLVLKKSVSLKNPQNVEDTCIIFDFLSGQNAYHLPLQFE